MPRFPAPLSPSKLLLRCSSNTDMDPLTQAFPRYARHQSPAPILARASLKRPLPQAPITISKRGRLQASTAKVCTWSDVRVLGTMIQGATKLLIVSTHEDNSKLMMLCRAPSAEQKHRVGLRHPNLLGIELVLKDNDHLFDGYAYARTTLEDICNVHVPLGEDEIKLIARSVGL